jgi:hypothetical protein
VAVELEVRGNRQLGVRGMDIHRLHNKDIQVVIQVTQLQRQMIIIQAAAAVLEEQVLVVQVMLALME